MQNYTYGDRVTPQNRWGYGGYGGGYGGGYRGYNGYHRGFNRYKKKNYSKIYSQYSNRYNGNNKWNRYNGWGFKETSSKIGPEYDPSAHFKNPYYDLDYNGRNYWGDMRRGPW